MRVPVLVLALAAYDNVAAEVYLTEGTNISVDVAADGRAAIDLLGGLWIVPAGGGEAEALQEGLRPAHRPRWSPIRHASKFHAIPSSEATAS